MSGPGDLHPALVAGPCAGRRFGHTVVLFDEVDSTNSAAAALADRGAPEGTVVTAMRQTAGRGRLGRRWWSTERGSLVFSITARPKRDPSSLTTVLALAAAEAIEAVAGKTSIKWPNDIRVSGRKCAGILAESAGGRVVLGMGIDVNEEPGDLAPELGEEAVSLRMIAGRPIDRAGLLCDLLRRFSSRYGTWEREGFSAMRMEAERRLLWKGRLVRVVEGGRTETGIVLGLTDQGYLRLGLDGVERIVAAGDASLPGEAEGDGE